MRRTIGAWLLLATACAENSSHFHDDQEPSARKRIFYLHNGTLGKIADSGETRTGLEVADAACTSAGTDRGFGGAWRAWLSSSSVDAIDRIDDVAPWYRTDQETLLFATLSELATGPRATIDPLRDGEVMFWSGTNRDGIRTSHTCADWTVYNTPAVATVGRVDATGARWVAESPLLCANYLALLCIEQ